MNNQVIDFNMESPEADSKKGIKRNSALFLLNSDVLNISVQEKHFKMERDEEALIKQLRSKMNSQNELDTMLNSKQGGAEEKLKTPDSLKGLDDIIPKKRVETNTMNPKTLFNQ
jgi:hypothetical protein